MADNEIEIAASPERVWRVLADPHVYDEWVLGAQAIREADAAWPEVGAKLHHRTGVGPLTLDDETEVEQSTEPLQLVLLARVRPAGEFRITLDLRPSAAGTTVLMHEEPVAGVAERVSGTGPAIHARNAVSLRRLKELVEAQPAGAP